MGIRKQKKLFSKKVLLGLLGLIGSGIFYAIVNAIVVALINNKNFWKSLKDSFINLGKFIINLKVPDIVYIIIVLIVLSWLILNRKKIREILNADVGSLRKDFKDYKKEIGNRKNEILKLEKDIRKKQSEIIQSFRSVIGKVERYEKIKPTEGLIFILERLGSEVNKTMAKIALVRFYKRNFKNLNPREVNLDFNFNTNSAEMYNLIKPLKGQSGLVYYKITRIGLEYLKEQKIRKKNEKKNKI